MGLLTGIFIYSLPSENVTITIWTGEKKDKVQMLILTFVFLWRSLPKKYLKKNRSQAPTVLIFPNSPTQFLNYSKWVELSLMDCY